MAMNAKTATGGAGGGSTPALEAGTYPARLVQVLDCGKHPQSYKGEEKDPRQEIMLTYELCDEFLMDRDGNVQEDKPRWVSESFVLYNLGSEKAKSTKRYMVLDPAVEKGGDFTQLLGTPVNVTLVQNPGKGANAGKVFANVDAISPMRAKDAERAPELINNPVVFDLDAPDTEVFFSLPEWIRKRIASNLEFEGSLLARQIGDSDDKPQVDEDPDEGDEPY